MNDMWGNPIGNMVNNNNNFGFNRSNMGNNFTGNFSPALPRYEIIKVNGEAGAKNFRMAANSTALLLDENEPIVWFVQTDGAGYCVATPYDITPHHKIPPVDVNQLEQRVAQLEEMINVRQSNTQSNKQSKKQSKQQQPISEQSLDTTT